MKAQIIVLLSVLLLTTYGCSTNKEDSEPQLKPDPETGELYFPEIDSTTWETISLQELGWNLAAEASLYQLLEEKNTMAFIILKDGKIAIEKYFGSFTQDSIWYWASAGKTLTGFTIGIAQEQGLLNLNEPSSKYLGEGWTATTVEEENNITIRNQLTMTTGLRNNLLVFSCTDADCLKFEAEPGTRWSYHNGPYTLLQNVVSNASDTPFITYFNTQLRNKIGMDGIWIPNGSNNTFYSTARSMARFGLLNLNNGKWGDQAILGDATYLSEMKSKSQELNKSYGYLWWLNGEDDHMGTATQEVFPGMLLPNAPADTYAGLGKNDQKLYVIPSEGLVVVRLGEDAGENQLGPSSFDNQLWEKISAVIK